MESLKLTDHGQLPYYFQCVLVAIFWGMRGGLAHYWGELSPQSPPTLVLPLVGEHTLTETIAS